MCGRYALTLRPSVVRERLSDQHLTVDDAPSDDDAQVRQTYNFAPGYHGLIYRGGSDSNDEHQPDHDTEASQSTSADSTQDRESSNRTIYKLQAAKWGLIPFWTKRPPDYAGQMRTINCRDDSLIEDRGMWNTMKKRKRCVVVAEGFYEWLKKNDGKEKIPHFVKRKDGALMCFAGLWDMVQYEGSEEKLYTYTIITTDSNEQLKFLHDRMPVILEPGSEEMRLWLDPQNIGWSRDLQRMLKSFPGPLDCYVVDKGVGKVGNNSPSFVVPVDSKENKKNIANFFDRQRQKTGDEFLGDRRETTVKVEGSESNAPLPKPKAEPDAKFKAEIKQEPSDHDVDGEHSVHDSAARKIAIKREHAELDDADGVQNRTSPRKVAKTTESPPKNSSDRASPAKKTRSATSNSSKVKTPIKSSGNAKITNFFGGKD